MILQALRERRCVPFLGAGVNASTSGYQGLPLGGEVALRLLESLLGIRVPSIEQLVEVTLGPLGEQYGEQYKELVWLRLQDLARVALHVEVMADKEYLVGELQSILPDERCEPSRALRTLARLPLELIVTTNYDRLMERALEEAGQPPPLIIGPPIGGPTLREQRRRLQDHTGLVLYKIHGTFGGASTPSQHDGGRSPVIISEEDYIDFLTVAPLKDIGVPRSISAKMANSVLLFLGYGLEDWDFRTIHKVLIGGLRPNSRRKSFAIQKDPSPLWVRFWDRKGVEIHNMDLYEFMDELEVRYTASAET
jgi:hypothetical protein